jgi:hypothetical protein
LRFGVWDALTSNKFWWESTKVISFEKAVKALTGFIFLVLGLTALNYGTKLETAISESIIDKNGRPIAKELKGMDIRILTITIILSLIFICRSLMDSLFAWNILHINLESPFIDLILILFTEITPALIIT